MEEKHRDIPIRLMEIKYFHSTSGPCFPFCKPERKTWPRTAVNIFTARILEPNDPGASYNIGFDPSSFSYLPISLSLIRQNVGIRPAPKFLNDSGAPVAQQVKRWPTDLAVPGSSPTRDGNLSNREQGTIEHDLFIFVLPSS